MPAALAEIASIVRDVLHNSSLELGESTRFEDLAGWDSMDLISIVVEAECRYDVQFDVREIDVLATVDDLIAMIETKQTLAAA